MLKSLPAALKKDLAGSFGADGDDFYVVDSCSGKARMLDDNKDLKNDNYKLAIEDFSQAVD